MDLHGALADPAWDAAGSSTISSLCVFDGDLIVGGYFNKTLYDSVSIARIARWTGSTWRPLGSGLPSKPFELAVHNGDLIAGAQYVKRWNGASWEDISPDPFGGSVSALETYNGDLFIGGNFHNPSKHIGRWDGSEWSRLGSGASDAVMALLTKDDHLFMGGRFTHVDGILSEKVARWDDLSIQILSHAFDDTLYQNGVDVVNLEVIVRNNDLDSWSGSLSADLQPDFGPQFHMGDEVLFLAPGEARQTDFSWELPDSQYVWEFDAGIVLSDESAPAPLITVPVTDAFVGNPHSREIIEQHQQEITDCLFDTDYACDLEMVALVPYIGVTAHFGLFVDEYLPCGRAATARVNGRPAVSCLNPPQSTMAPLRWHCAGSVNGRGQLQSWCSSGAIVDGWPRSASTMN